MRILFSFILFLLLIMTRESSGQDQKYIVNVSPFSSRLADEFAPVYYRGGLVFCSNMSDGSFVRYQQDNKKLYKIFYLPVKNDNLSKFPKLLASEITSEFNDGPVTFNDSGNVIYFSRNNFIENSMRNINDSTNKLGIYIAELVNGTWSSIKPFAYNDPQHSLTTPSLAPQGNRLYFSSDIPGGMGGMDLYYCDRRNNSWDEPVNLGPLINTPANESFPFAAIYGILFFASDGLPGFGGKDLYYSRQINGEWISPVHLDSAINSPADDFGLVTDSTLKSGYFSTNRLRTDDIFSFSAAPEEFNDCAAIEDNNFCFTLYDEKYQTIDTIPVSYAWDFGNGVKRHGPEVKHCFPGPGDYLVILTITDELTGKPVAEQVEYRVLLENKAQAFISSYNIGVIDKPVLFDGSAAGLPGFRITDYFWNFGNGFKPGGQNERMIFRKEGEYSVRLGLLGEKDSSGIRPRTCVMKKIKIFNDVQELTLRDFEKENSDAEHSFSGQVSSVKIRMYLMDDLTSRQKTSIKESIKRPFEPVVRFDSSGILPASYTSLELIAGILKKDHEIKVETILHSPEALINGGTTGIFEQWARELDFYFKNLEIERDTFNSFGSGLPDSTFDKVQPEDNTINGVMELVFMHK